MEKSLKHCAEQKKKHKRIHSLWLNLCGVQKQAKPTCNNKWVRGWRDWLCSGTEGLLGCWKCSPPSLWWWLSYMGMYICQNLLKSFKQIDFIMYVTPQQILIKRFSFLKGDCSSVGETGLEMRRNPYNHSQVRRALGTNLYLAPWCCGELRRGRWAVSIPFRGNPSQDLEGKGESEAWGEGLGSPRTDSP